MLIIALAKPPYTTMMFGPSSYLSSSSLLSHRFQTIQNSRACISSIPDISTFSWSPSLSTKKVSLRDVYTAVKPTAISSTNLPLSFQIIPHNFTPPLGYRSHHTHNPNHRAFSSSTTVSFIPVSATTSHSPSDPVDPLSNLHAKLPLNPEVPGEFLNKDSPGGFCTVSSSSAPTGTELSSSSSILKAGEDQKSSRTEAEFADDEPKTLKEKVVYWLRGYASLSKFKLNLLVLATSMFGFALAPIPATFGLFLSSSVGTFLTISSACCINQLIEIKNDSNMLRTKTRWLPSQRITVTHATTFSIITGAIGVGILYFLVNPLSAALALGNLIIYTAIYTPMKQKKPLNTWVGAIVGAIPPMIGWASVTAALEPGSWVLAGLLGVWQLPHFMALSYALKDDYQRGGFKMLINVNPEKVPGVILRYSLLMATFGPLAYLTDITNFWFVIDSLIPSAYLIFQSIRFYRQPNPTLARKIFRYSLIMLPVLMLLMIFHSTALFPPSELHDPTNIVEIKESNQS